MLEGEPEPIIETLYESALGFSFWYDAELFAVDESASEDGASLVVFPADTDLPAFMELMLPEAVGVTPGRYLELHADPETEYDYDILDSGAELVGFRKPRKNGLVESYYVITTEETFLAVFVQCPAEALEGFGARLLAMLNTVSFESEPLIRVSFAAEGADSVSVSDDPQAVAVCFSASERVTQFTVLALEAFEEDGSLSFRKTPVYTADALSPELPLNVTMIFFGDIPNNGIFYIDAQGFGHTCAVGLSGKDGSPMLWEID